MAKKDDEKTAAGDAPAETPQAAPGQAAPGQTLQQTIRIDDSASIACYANFARVSYTPEELILDLGLNPQPFGQGEVTVKVQQRIILNFYTAKRLLSALAGTLQRHEQAFGVLETDVRKRVKQG